MRHLLVVAPNWVGDTVLCTPFLSNLRHALPQASLDVLAVSRVAPLLQSHPAIDHLIVTPDGAGHRKWWPRLHLIRVLREKRYDGAFLLPHSFAAALLAWSIRARRRIGYARDGRRFLLTDPLPWSQGDPSTREHQVEEYLRLLQPLDLPVRTRELSLPLTPAAEAFAKEVWERYRLSTAQRVIGINPGAAFGPAKRWLPSRFALLADALQQAGLGQVLFLGSPEEVGLVEAIRHQMRTTAISLAGRDTLETLPALIRRCALLITNDSGPMHIASALQVPVVALFGPTDPRRTGPYRVAHVVLQKELPCTPCFHRVCPLSRHACMEGIEVEEVLQAASRLLEDQDAG